MYVKLQSSHLRFKNTPIDGTLTTFIENMKDEGFSLVYISTDQTGAIMKGRFVDEECEIVVRASTKTNIVYRIYATLKKNKNWYSLKSDYFTFKDAYIKNMANLLILLNIS